MRLRHPLLLTVVALALAWATVPPGEVDLDLACQPSSPRARFSAAVTGDWFWRRQLAAIVAERDRWLAIQGRGMFGTTTEGSAGESHMSRLVEPEHEDAARRFRQNRVAWTATCAQVIERRLASE